MKKNDERVEARGATSGGAGWFLLAIGALFALAIVFGLLTS